MFTIVAISVSALSAPYMLQHMCLVDYRIRLRKKTLAAVYVLVWLSMLLAIQPPLLADTAPFRFTREYGELVFVLALSLAMLAGRLLRPWKHSFYQRLS